jgi:hypothetical protein
MTYLKLVNYLLSGVKLTVCLVGETRPWSGLTLLSTGELGNVRLSLTGQFLTVWGEVDCLLGG